jgi:hypothetical protein
MTLTLELPTAATMNRLADAAERRLWGSPCNRGPVEARSMLAIGEARYRMEERYDWSADLYYTQMVGVLVTEDEHGNHPYGREADRPLVDATRPGLTLDRPRRGPRTQVPAHNGPVLFD